MLGVRVMILLLLAIQHHPRRLLPGYILPLLIWVGTISLIWLGVGGLVPLIGLNGGRINIRSLIC